MYTHTHTYIHFFTCRSRTVGHSSRVPTMMMMMAHGLMYKMAQIEWKDARSEGGMKLEAAILLAISETARIRRNHWNLSYITYGEVRPSVYCGRYSCKTRWGPADVSSACVHRFYYRASDCVCVPTLCYSKTLGGETPKIQTFHVLFRQKWYACNFLVIG